MLTLFYALSYPTDMHDLRLIHTDLKPENILLVSSEFIKLPGYKVFGLLELKSNVILDLDADLVIIFKKLLGIWYRGVLQVKCLSGACQSQVPLS